MAPLLVVIGAHARNVTPSRGFISRVKMIVADSLWPKINSCGGENTVVEVPGQRRVTGMEAAEFVNVFFIQFRCIRCEGTCKDKRLPLRQLWSQRVPTATKTSNPLDVRMLEQASTHSLIVLCLFKPHGFLYA